MSTQAELDERLAAEPLEQIERAQVEVRRLCQPGTRWRMTIPVDVDDSDVVITGALVAARKALADLEAENAKLRAALEDVAVVAGGKAAERIRNLLLRREK